MKKLLFCITVSLGLGAAACAQAAQPDAAVAADVPKAGTPEARARDALISLDPQVQIDYIGAAALPGFREVLVGGRVVLVSDDGKYLLQGQVLDIDNKKELTQSSPALSRHRTNLLASVKPKDRIVFAPPNAKYTISVFTDIECGYCRKLHNEIAEYNRRGIAVEYLAFPRNGLGSQDHKDMISVWCANDRKSALTEAKAGKPVPARQCDTAVDLEFSVGQRLGITGTPAIFTADGTQLGGYLTPDKLREALDALAGNPVSAVGGGAN